MSEVPLLVFRVSGEGLKGGGPLGCIRQEVHLRYEFKVEVEG